MSFEQQLNRAADLARAGRFDEAESACRSLLQKKPKSFDALQLLGLAQSELGRPTEAIATLKKAIAKDREHAGVRNNLGNALMSLGRYEEAHRAFTQATELAPTAPEAYVGLGRSLAMLGRLPEAVRSLERALRAAPDFPEALDTLGYCLMKQGKLSEAMRKHLAAADAAPMMATAYVNLFNTLMYMHVTDDARTVATAGAKALPEGSAEVAELQIGLAKLAWIEGRFKDLGVALDASESIQTQFDGYPNLGNLRVFQRYLRWLYDFRQGYEGGIYGGDPRRALFFVSESHGFGPSETVVSFEGEPHRVLSVLITGCKAYHLGLQDDNEHRASVRAITKAIPSGHPIVFGFGEIDCRATEGILKAHRDKGVDYRTAVPDLVRRYVAFVVDAAHEYGHTPILYGVPAPHTEVVAALSEDDRVLLIDIVRVFNDALRVVCEERQVRLLDVHAYTASVEGVADGRKHVDRHHVHPETVPALMGGHRSLNPTV